jgi:hypothetical protein
MLEQPVRDGELPRVYGDGSAGPRMARILDEFLTRGN